MAHTQESKPKVIRHAICSGKIVTEKDGRRVCRSYYSGEKLEGNIIIDRHQRVKTSRYS